MTKIKINDIEYNIKDTVSTSDTLNAGRYFGVFLPRQHEIHVANDISKSVREDTIAHELVHLLTWESSFDAVLMDKLGEYYEPFIDSMGKALKCLIKEIKKGKL